jgi:hypothetical protein
VKPAFLCSNRGFFYLKLGQLDRAIADFDAALSPAKQKALGRGFNPAEGFAQEHGGLLM